MFQLQYAQYDDKMLTDQKSGTSMFCSLLNDLRSNIWMELARNTIID